MQQFRQLSWAVEMGPFSSFGSFLRQQKWAHTAILAVILGSRNGPIQQFWQLSYAVEMGPYSSFSIFLGQ
jgi:hypothetical protein